MHNLQGSIYRKNLKWGRAKSKLESQLFERAERATESSMFQDLGIRKRSPVKPPNYKNEREFLKELESSDEELAEIGDVVPGATRPKKVNYMTP